MRYYDDRGASFIRVAAQVVTFVRDTSSQIQVWDPFVFLLHNTTWDLGWFPVTDTLGWFPDKGTLRDVRINSKPRAFDYNKDSDFAKYGSKLGLLAESVRVFDKGSLPFRPGAEHQVLHSHYTGDVGPALYDNMLPYDYDAFDLISNDFLAGYCNRPTYVRDGGLGFANQSLIATASLGGLSFASDERRSGTAPRSDALTTLKYLTEEAFGGNFYSWDWHQGSARNTILFYGLRVEYDRWGFKLQYNLINAYDVDSPSYHYGNEWEFEVTLEFHVTPQLPSQGSEDLDNATLQACGTCHMDQVWVCTRIPATHTGGWHAGIVPGGFYSIPFEDSNFVYTSNPVQGTNEHTEKDLRRFVASPLLGSFYTEVSNAWGDIRLASSLTAGQAFSQVDVSNKTNVLQTLQHLKDLSSLVPQLGSALASWKDFSRGDFVGSIGHAISFFTGLQIQSKFQYEPNVRFIVETLPKMGRVLSELSQIDDSEPVIGRGSFTMDFPLGTFGRRECHLEVHTKILADGPNDFLGSMLGLRDLGLYPGAANIWDLLPFTFVVNWFTGIGQRLRDIEAFEFLLLSGTHCYVHSYKVTSPLTDGELAAYNLTKSSLSESADKPGMQIYLREVSMYPPRLQDGRFDFHRPQGVPSWLTAGSLAWQLLFA